MQLNVNEIWDQIIPSLETSLSKPMFETLISSTKPLSISENKFVIAVANEVVRQWLSLHCDKLLSSEIQTIIEVPLKVEFVVGSKDLFNTPPLSQVQPVIKDIKSDAVQSKINIRPNPNVVEGSLPLNYRYTFENFVIGHGNRFAHAASLAVAETPAAAYNPLFLYGGVGLGKTHLMQAIAHYAIKQNQNTKILYTTSEMFTNELINAIRDDKTLAFRNKYRNIDILLVDDIQFLAGKERTQEEFFHTFNALYEANKQIVVSSDRPPKEIPTLEERLRSRFEWGLIADIQSPDFETRIAILRKKKELGNLPVSDEVINLLATKIISNIRELEGSLIRVVAYASLNKKEISLDLVNEVLADLIPELKSKHIITIDMIKKATAEYFSINVTLLSDKIRTREIATARQVAMYLCREHSKQSLPKIGGSFGGRDHTTVMHAHEKIGSIKDSDLEIKKAIDDIKETLKI